MALNYDSIEYLRDLTVNTIDSFDYFSNLNEILRFIHLTWTHTHIEQWHCSC